MLRTALVHIRDSINLYYKNEYKKDKMLVLTNLQNADGTTPDDVSNKMVFFLTGLSEETTLKNSLNRIRNGSEGGFVKAPKNLHLNMYLLFCANFEGITGYEEGLAYLSSLVRFFQLNKILHVPKSTTNAQTSDSETTIDRGGDTSKTSQSRLTFELCKLEYSELSHLWSAIGGKLRPSVLYKVGIVTFDDVRVTETIPAITEI